MMNKKYRLSPFGVTYALLFVFALIVMGVHVVTPRIMHAQMLKEERIRQEEWQEMLESAPEEMRMFVESITDENALYGGESYLYKQQFFLDTLVRERPELLEENEWLAEYYAAINSVFATD